MIKPKPFLTKMFTSTLQGSLDVLDIEAEGIIPKELEDLISTLPIPPELRNFILPLKKTTGHTAVGMLLAMAIGMVAGTAIGIAKPIANVATYQVEKLVSSFRFDPSSIAQLLRREFPNEVQAQDWLFDLKDTGFSEHRIDAFKELMNVIPPLSDMVRFADFSAFDPEVLEKWKEFATCPEWLKKPFGLVGITGMWADKYWFSHFVQPQRFELGEMHRRELIDDDEVKLAYKTMGYSSYWQDKLLTLVRAIPTRVDVRRWWDMRTIDEVELRRIYHAQGYYDEDLENYVLWTKVYVAFPDLVARYKNGYIPAKQIVTELVALGMPADRATELFETKIKKVYAPERVAPERDLTVTDITMGLKKEIIDRDAAIEMIMELGYDMDEATFKIDARVAAAGSPESYIDFKVITNEYRKSQGQEVKEIPPELLEADKILTGLKNQLTKAEREEQPLDDIAQLKAAKELALAKYLDFLSAYQA